VFPLPLTLIVAPSRRMRADIAVLHLLAGAALWLAALPIQVQVAGSLVLALHLALRPCQSVATTLRGKADGSLEIRQGEAWQAVETLRVFLCTPVLTLLCYRLAGESFSRTLPILDDSLPEADFRRLCVWLKWLGGKVDAQP
jgi:hypothetical protein